MLFQIRKRFARLNSFHPQAHLAQFYGHGVDVYAVDAASNHITQCLAPRFWRWLLFSSANGSQSFGNSMCCCDQEVSTTTGGIADLEVEDSSFGIRFSAGFIQHR